MASGSYHTLLLSFCHFFLSFSISTRRNSGNNFLFNINNRSTKRRGEICSKFLIKIPEWRHWHGRDVFIVNFQHISHLFLVFLLFTLNKWMLAGKGLHTLCRWRELSSKVLAFCNKSYLQLLLDSTCLVDSRIWDFCSFMCVLKLVYIKFLFLYFSIFLYFYTFSKKISMLLGRDVSFSP